MSTEDKRQAFLEDIETVYEMWKKSDFNSEQQSHLGNLMFNIVKEAKVFPQAAEFYLNLRFILRVIPDMYNYQMQFYLSFLGRLNDPYDYLEKDTLVQTYKTAVDNYKPVGNICFGYAPASVNLTDQGTNAQGEWEDLTKRLRTGKIY
jgi:hypothetical protein